jgi:hypothetical protein
VAALSGFDGKNTGFIVYTQQQVHLGRAEQNRSGQDQTWGQGKGCRVSCFQAGNGRTKQLLSERLYLACNAQCVIPGYSDDMQRGTSHRHCCCGEGAALTGRGGEHGCSTAVAMHAWRCSYLP